MMYLNNYCTEIMFLASGDRAHNIVLYNTDVDSWHLIEW